MFEAFTEPLGSPGPDDRVQLVDEREFAFGLQLRILDHQLLEVAPAAGTGDQCAGVEGEYAACP